MKILITGGCGFVGSNLADYFLKKENEVIIFDNLFRKGVTNNLEWLKTNSNLTFINGDIRRSAEIEKAAKECNIIYHTAAQTTVTDSIKDPRKDFEINALGTFNTLEAARKNDTSIIICSTNKVYGNNVNKLPIEEKKTRYEFTDSNGIDENFPIDAKEHTPYGSSKLTADQYTRDYSEVYGINTIVNRMSCIYGTRQFGTIDQGWIVHFIISAINNKPLIIYGDGKQVRDILFISDLVELFEKETEKIKQFSGKAYNVGGGKENTISILELLELLEHLTNKKVSYTFSDWRPADQKVFYCDTIRAKKDFDWSPKIKAEEGIKKTFDWLSENKELFS